MRLPGFEYQAPVPIKKAIKIKKDFGSVSKLSAGWIDRVSQQRNRTTTLAALISIVNFRLLRGAEKRTDMRLLKTGTVLSDVAEAGRSAGEHPGRRGRPLNPALLAYKTPTTGEMPCIGRSIMDSRDPVGPYGVREAGMFAAMFTRAHNEAGRHAPGIFSNHNPLTPERILDALENKTPCERTDRMGSGAGSSHRALILSVHFRRNSN